MEARCVESVTTRQTKTIKITPQEILRMIENFIRENRDESFYIKDEAGLSLRKEFCEECGRETPVLMDGRSLFFLTWAEETTEVGDPKHEFDILERE